MHEKTRITRQTIWAVVFMFLMVGLLLPGQRAEAREHKYPAGAITVINPLKPGGGTDIELRNLAPFLQKYLGQPIVILGKPGAAMTIGCSAAASAKPDGYTLLALPLTSAILSQEFHHMTYNLADFEPIYGWFEGPMDVTVNVNSPYKTFSDLVSAGRKRSLKSSLAGIGGLNHLQTLLLDKYTGMKPSVNVPFGGGGPAAAAVIKGEVDFCSGLSTTSVRFVRGGKLRQLVILGPKPLKALPETPTIYQLGYKNWPYIPFIRGILAPPGTPRDRVKILQAAFKKAVDDPGFRALMKKQGRPVTPFTGAQMKKAAQRAVKVAREYVPFMRQAARQGK